MAGRLTLLVALLLLWWPLPSRADGSIDRGRALAQRQCAQCHSISATSDSPRKEAPAFRTLGERYPVENLAEALAEGLYVGHSAMPEFQLMPREINDFLDFLRSLSKPAGRTK